MNAPGIEMPKYRSHKQVWALEIENIGEPSWPTQNNPGQARKVTFLDQGFAPMKLPEEMFSRYVPVAGDFYVVYEDGYKSFSPRKAFLEGYTRI